jgi:hypothetical protein
MAINFLCSSPASNCGRAAISFSTCGHAANKYYFLRTKTRLGGIICVCVVRLAWGQYGGGFHLLRLPQQRGYALLRNARAMGCAP